MSRSASFLPSSTVLAAPHWLPFAVIRTIRRPGRRAGWERYVAAAALHDFCWPCENMGAACEDARYFTGSVDRYGRSVVLGEDAGGEGDREGCEWEGSADGKDGPPQQATSRPALATRCRARWAGSTRVECVECVECVERYPMRRTASSASSASHASSVSAQSGQAPGAPAPGGRPAVPAGQAAAGRFSPAA